jgi:hypothetical protein
MIHMHEVKVVEQPTYIMSNSSYCARHPRSSTKEREGIWRDLLFAAEIDPCQARYANTKMQESKASCFNTPSGS